MRIIENKFTGDGKTMVRMNPYGMAVMTVISK
jgi:hypothetical protein